MPKRKKKSKEQDAAAVLGRKGGHATAKKMSKKWLKERAKKAAVTRWKKTKGPGYQEP